MGGIHAVSMGDRGRVVVPLELRERQGMTPGTPLLMVETPRGIVLTTREQAKALVREQLRGGSLVAELVAERRRAAAEDDR